MYNYIVYFGIIYYMYYSRNNIHKKWLKWLQLNKLFSEKTNNIFLIQWYSLKMTSKILWVSIIQYLNNTVVCVDKNKYEVSYVIKGKLYKFYTITNRGPTPILKIMNNDINVTNLVVPYLGPKFKGHNIDLSPQLLGYSSLTFQMKDDKIYKYSEDDIIKLN